MVVKNLSPWNVLTSKIAGVVLLGLGALAGGVQAQVYVGDASGSFLIGKYTTAGATVNASLITPAQYPAALAVSDSSLFVSDATNYHILKYNKADGSLVSGTFISSPDVTMPYGLAVAGSYLYVASFGGGKVGKFDVSTGTAVNAALITGLSGPWAIAVDGSTLYVSDFGGSKIGKYATDGTVVNASFITVNSPAGIGVWGPYLYVMTANDIRKYNKADGSLVDANFLTGLSSPTNLAIADGYLYVTCENDNAVRKYALPSGTEVGSPLISGLHAPFSIAVEPQAATPTPTPTSEAPTVTIKGPKKVTTSEVAYMLKGTASANATRVIVKVGKIRAFKTTPVGTSWKCKILLSPGKNKIVAQSFNSAGDVSAPATVVITRK